MKGEIKQLVYFERLKDPIASQKDLAIKLGLSESMVSRAIKSMMGTHDYQFRQLLAGKFLEEFQMASDYWKMQITQLENLKDSKKTIFKKAADGHVFPEEVELEVDDMMKIMKEQSDRWEKILFLARQGEAVEVMRLMKNGTTQLPVIN